MSVNESPASSSFSSVMPQYKILVIGEEGVGKTSLKIRYTDKDFNPNTEKNKGIDFKTKKVKLMSSSDYIQLSIWDTACSEKYNSIAKNYLRNAQGILLCFDISNRASFEELNNFWYNLINEYFNLGKKNHNAWVLFLVGNKFDLSQEDESKRQVTELRMRECKWLIN